MKTEPKDIEEAYLYILDCNLATVADMAMKSKPPIGETKRHILIAQRSIDNFRVFGERPFDRRSLDIITNHGGDVTKYFYAVRERFHADKPVNIK